MNPGGSVKDRVALRSVCPAACRRELISDPLAVIEDAEERGLLHPHTGSRIFEGTVGSTGISIATIARAKYVSRLPTVPSSSYMNSGAMKPVCQWPLMNFNVH